VERSGIDGRKKVNAVTKEERRALLTLLKGLPVTVKGFRPIEEAIVTKGGVALGEVDPRTMASKKAEGLYFAGELLDLDAYTGGFNLQIAFSTAVLAGESAAIEVLSAD
jgi:predicted flavoprotein YhiN